MTLGKQLSFGLAVLVWACWALPCQADTAPPAEHGAHSTTTDHADGHDAHGAAGHGDHHAGEPNPLALSIDLAVWTLVVFVLLLTILRKFAWGPIVEALQRREQGIADHIASAERQNEEARRLLGEYDQRLKNASNQVRELLEEARRDAEHTKTEILSEAKVAAQAEHERAVREIRNATDGALKELSETSAHLAVDLAGKVLSERLDATNHERLVREALGRFPDRVERN